MLPNTEVIESVAIKPVAKREVAEVKKAKFPPIDYDGIANKFTLDSTQPPKPENFLNNIVYGNFFDDDDKPTLSGKIVEKVYGELVKRKDMLSLPENIKASHVDAVNDFKDTVAQTVKSRSGEVGAKQITASLTRAEGTNGFHFDGETGAEKDHSYYFNKSTAYWKKPREGLTRAYITVKPEEATQIQRHFVKLSMNMFDAGIDFNAKATGVKGTLQRTDNMVFYISESDRDRAGEIMSKFLEDNPIAGGKVDVATVDKQAGLTWAPEPGKAETDFYQKVTGSSKRTSFNGFVAARAMPRYLDRLSLANARAGDTKSAREYFTELKRVNGILLDIKEGK